MNIEIANKCPRCGEPVLVSAMHAGGVREQQEPFRDTVQAHDLALGYQCVPCDWYVIQPEANKLSAADFLAGAVGSEAPQ